MQSDPAKILIVDDQLENLMALEAVLGDLGQIVKAQSGREALKHLLDSDFAIIIMDIKMPGMSGFETAQLIRQRQRCRLTPIIFLTAMFTEDIHESQGYAMGAVDFMTKPFVPDILKSKVSVFVELFRKTQEIQRQAELINQIERKRSQMERERVEAESQLIKEELLRREAERELLVERSLQLQKSEQLKTEFLANMSHEIRTPMHGIVGFTELLMRTQLNAEQMEYAGFISTAAQSLLTLINDILDLSKVEAGKLDLETVDFDLRALVEGTAALVSESVKEKNLSLMSYVDTEMPPVIKGDPGRLRQILLNLISNAVKFTNEGEVVVRCQIIEDEQTNQLDAIKVMFSVSDTGIGISQNQMANLFKPFSQADGSTTRKFGGTGLGLSISKRLVELMGGEIGADSELEKGSNFWFKVSFPVSGSRKETSVQREGIARPKVLVIDNHASARHIMQSYIKSWSMDCDVAMSGPEGMQLMQAAVQSQRPYDIVITDLLLPGIDGLRLRELMSQDPELSKTKTILVTGHNMKDQGNTAIQAGFCAYLTKPIEQSRLFNAISHILATQPVFADPNSDNHNGSLEETISPEEQQTDGTLILLAEDNPVNQKVATLQLKQLGFECVAVPNGKEAVKEFSRGIYALVLMDCQMPEMDGFQATKQIRDTETLKGTHIPIIGLTAYAMEGDRDRCIAIGMDDYLSKPSSFEKLSGALKRWLPQHANAIDERQKTLPKQTSAN